MNSVSTEGRANGPPALPAFDAPAVQAAQPLPRNAPRWLLWMVGAMVGLACITAFLLWGINGPTYIFDLIAAYCFG